MKKLAAILGVVAAMVLAGCAGGGGTVADPQKPWTAFDAQRWNDPSATQVRWKPSDLDWSAKSARSLGDVNSIAQELAFNTNWPTLVKFFEGVPPARQELRDELFSKSVQGGHFRGVGVHYWSDQLALLSRNSDLGGQIWQQARKNAWNAWTVPLSEDATSAGLSIHHIHYEPERKRIINHRGAWVVLWLAYQQSLGNRGALDHLNSDWFVDGNSNNGGVEVLDGVGCGEHAYVAWMVSNLRNLNLDGMARAGDVRSSFFHKTGGWPKSKCDALIQNWPEYSQIQIERFNSFPRRQRLR